MSGAAVYPREAPFERGQMDSADQVILVLELIMTFGPVAVYFLGLGRPAA